MSRRTVRGPGPEPCGPLRLRWGIKVTENATLNLSFAEVLEINDTPKHDCNHGGSAIVMGTLFSGDTGHAHIHHVLVRDFQSGGILVFEPGSDAIISDNVIDAAVAPTDVVFTGGIEVGQGAVARVTRNSVRGSRCSGPELGCGPDPIAQLQGSGFTNGPGAPPGPGTEFDHNLVFDNDVGIYLAFTPGSPSVHHNSLVNNSFFGIAIQDSSNEVADDIIVGGSVGVGVIADAEDSVATLRHERIFATKLAPTETIECCGFKASVVTK